MGSTLEVLFSPVEYHTRTSRGFTGSVCVVFDVLRATSVMVTGLANGAQGFIPVAEIPEALALRSKHPGALLAGERDGLRITAAQSGSVDFDLGNSPLEYTPERVRDRIIISTTTNGTRALRACLSATAVAVASFQNLTATADWLARLSPPRIVLICAGTAEFPALEDILCAGALCESMKQSERDDSAETARRAYREAQEDLMAAVAGSRNGRRLLANSDLHADVEFSLRRDTHAFAAVLNAEGVIRKAG
jgi:2-phosphosulfolactate phosphatase